MIDNSVQYAYVPIAGLCFIIAIGFAIISIHYRNKYEEIVKMKWE